MGSVLRRVLLVLTGVLSLSFYVGLAVVFAAVVSTVLADPPPFGLVVAAIVAGALALGYLSYRAGAGQILVALDARPVPRERAPRLHERLDAIAARMNVGRPSVYVAALDAPNALAVGAACAAVSTPSLVGSSPRSSPAGSRPPLGLLGPH